ncbi:MAG TPA: aspartyl protease family protein [Caulobacteraceae bacterium]|jgi:hypothetical protein|nr:aspartyl protease family protein [Caulobacteraceae bacterium]
MRFRWLSTATLALALSTTPALAAPRPAAVIPLEPYLGVLWSFHAKVKGRDARFLLDTGGGLTVVSPDTAKLEGCTPWGQLTGFRMRGDRVDTPRCDGVAIDVQGVALHAPTAGVFDIGKLLPKDAPPLAGSVALDSFAGRIVTLDLAHKRLIVETPASARARTAHAREVAIRVIRDVEGLSVDPLLGIETKSGRIWLEIDCGSDGTVIVNRPIAAALGLDPNHKGSQPLDAVVAGGVPLHTRTLVQDLIIDGNIGSPVLSKWLLTLDLARQRAWIADAG